MFAPPLCRDLRRSFSPKLSTIEDDEDEDDEDDDDDEEEEEEEEAVSMLPRAFQ